MAAHPANFSDTDPQALDVWLNVIRKKTPGERILMAFELTDFALKMAESGVRARYPDAPEREIFLRCAALRLPRDLMIRAYGWDPDLHLEPEPR
jgi:hypothetical protein